MIQTSNRFQPNAVIGLAALGETMFNDLFGIAELSRFGP